MSQQDKITADDIDLLYVYNKFKRFLRSSIKSLFKALDFVLGKWIIVLVLLAAGIGLGYYLDLSSERGKVAEVLLKVNFDAGNYLYNTVGVLDNKLGGTDKAFLSSSGINQGGMRVQSLELEPIIDVADITNGFSETNRNLDAVLRYVEFNMEEEELYQTFTTDYDYHLLKVTLNSEGTRQDLEQIMDYINDNSILVEYRDNAIKTIDEKLDANKETLVQIESFLKEYLKQEQNPSNPSAQYYVERNTRPDLLLTTKNELLLENKTLKDEMVYYQQPVLAMSGLEVYPQEIGITDKKKIMLPIALVGLFLLIAYMRYLYFYLRNFANAA